MGVPARTRPFPGRPRPENSRGRIVVGSSLGDVGIVISLLGIDFNQVLVLAFTTEPVTLAIGAIPIIGHPWLRAV